MVRAIGGEAGALEKERADVVVSGDRAVRYVRFGSSARLEEGVDLDIVPPQEAGVEIIGGVLLEVCLML